MRKTKLKILIEIQTDCEQQEVVDSIIDGHLQELDSQALITVIQGKSKQHFNLNSPE